MSAGLAIVIGIAAVIVAALTGLTALALAVVVVLVIYGAAYGIRAFWTIATSWRRR